ncbi:MAG: hypothetical protein JWM16_3944 [Verrucomicrobiales bacterium]|nr:hypothetical protein [Verrucomicrobiales bacterium]
MQTKNSKSCFDDVVGSEPAYFLSRSARKLKYGYAVRKTRMGAFAFMILGIEPDDDDKREPFGLAGFSLN